MLYFSNYAHNILPLQDGSRRVESIQYDFFLLKSATDGICLLQSADAWKANALRKLVSEIRWQSTAEDQHIRDGNGFGFGASVPGPHPRGSAIPQAQSTEIVYRCVNVCFMENQMLKFSGYRITSRDKRMTMHMTMLRLAI